MRRKLQEERAALERNPNYPESPTCPAGAAVGETAQGRGCFCWVEETVLTVGDSPTSLNGYCFGNYLACPTWIAEKQRIEAAQKTRLSRVSFARPRRELVEVGDNTMVMAGPRDGRGDDVRVPG